jgi:hypothetical protein
VIDEMTPPVKLMRYTAISITGQLVLDVLDKSSELGVVEL